MVQLEIELYQVQELQDLPLVELLGSCEILKILRIHLNFN